jgi:SAM-dependent methyltransferase
MASWLQRLSSLRHGFWYGLSERLRWSRGAFLELPAHELPAASGEQAARIAALRDRYQIKFETQLSVATSVNNYEYLDILDRAWQAGGALRPMGGVVCDIGCASFWYAATLHAFFRPRELVGVEIEGHRLLRGGRARIDYAAGYARQLANTEFRVADYSEYRLAADVITAWFPFLTPAAILAWRLPLSLLAPQRLFRSIAQNLKPGGTFVMVNHGHREALLAQDWCIAAGLKLATRWRDGSAGAARRGEPAVLSRWTHGGGI